MDFILNKSTSPDDETTFSAQGLLTIKLTPDELKVVQDEIKKLKKENKKLKDDCVKSALIMKEFERFINKEKEENKKLEEENKVLLDTNVPIKILNENRELKEENERLDKKVGELQKIRETDIDFDLHNAHVNLLKGEIEELKQGIKELKEENGKMTALATECNELYKALGILHACMSEKSI